MDPQVLSSLIGAGAGVSISVVALLINYRGFVRLDNRLADMNRRMYEANHRDANRRIDGNDRIADKLGIPPR